MKKVGHIFLAFLLVFSTLITSVGTAFAAPGDIQVNFSDTSNEFFDARSIYFTVDTPGDYTMSGTFADLNAYMNIDFYLYNPGISYDYIRSYVSGQTITFTEPGTYMVYAYYEGEPPSLSDSIILTPANVTYDISSDTGTVNFADALYQSYNASTRSHNVTITKPTGSVVNDVTKVFGLGAASPFQILYDTGTLTNPAVDSMTFTVAPKGNLPVGTHTDTLTVEGSNSDSVEMTFNFTVLPHPDPVLGVDPTSHDFGELREGYSLTQQQIQLQKQGHSSTEITGLAASFETGTAFWIPSVHPNTLSAGTSSSALNVNVTANLPAGTYTDTLTFTADNQEPVSIDLSVTIIETHDITFISDGTTILNYDLDDGENITNIPANPTKTGHTFDGWYTMTDGEYDAMMFDFGNTVPDGDLVLYAKFTPISYQILFDENGGTNVPNVMIPYGETLDESMVPTREHYTFANWHTDFSLSEESIFTFDMPIEGAMTLYASWTPDEHELVLNVGTGDAMPSLATFYGETYPTPDDATKTGYTFVGWYTAPEGDESAVEFDFSATVTGDAVAYAHFTPNEYTVTFDAMNGDELFTDTGFYDDYFTEPDFTPTRDNYTFMYWYEEDPSVPFDFENTTVDGDLTLYAAWDPDDYTLTFDTQGGVAIDPMVIEYHEEYPELPTPTRTGYDFVGWFTGEEGMEGTMPFPTDSLVEGDITAYAHWTPIEYTLTFDTGVEGIDVDPVTGYYDSYFPDPEVTPERWGYTFAYWYADDENVPYDFDATLVTGDLTLNAKWIPDQYTIVYVENGGPDIANGTVYHDQIPTAPEMSIRTGYTFAGWFLDDGTFEQEFMFDTPAAGNLILYAKWEPTMYTVTFETNADVEMEPVQVGYYDTLTPPEAPMVDGFTFDGWYTDMELTNMYDFSMPVTGNFTLYAKWLSQSTEITFPWYEGGSPFPYDEDTATFTVPFNLSIGQWGEMTRPDDTASSYKYYRASGAIVTDFMGEEDLFSLYVEEGDYVLVTAEDDSFTMEYYFTIAEAAHDDMYHTPFETELSVSAEDGVMANDNLQSFVMMPLVMEDEMSPFTVVVTDYPENGELMMNADGSFDYMPNDGFSGDDHFTYHIEYAAPYFTIADAHGDVAMSDEATVTITVHEADPIPYIKGFGNGEFRPEAAVSRQEIAVMMARAMTGNNIPEATTSTFTDVTASWSKDGVEYMRANGIMYGMTETRFNPNGNLTRAQLAAMLDRYINGNCHVAEDFCDSVGMGDGFSDVPSSHWAYGSILRMQHYGTIYGFGDGTFRPEGFVTRAQATVMINRVLGLVPSASYDAPSFTDVPVTHWAYRDIERATRGY